MFTTIRKPLIASLMLISCSAMSIGAPVLAATTSKSSGASFRAMMYNPKKTYKDEKVAINDPTTRCLTSTTSSLHQKATKQSQDDAKKYDISSSSTGGIAKAYKNYENDLGLAWEAMKEPYCGFGAFGLSAAVKSYSKSVSRARTRFLDAMKDPKSLEKDNVVAAQLQSAGATSTMADEARSDEVVAPAAAPMAPAPAPTPVATAETVSAPVAAAVIITPKPEVDTDQETNDDGIPLADLMSGFMK